MTLPRILVTDDQPDVLEALRLLSNLVAQLQPGALLQDLQTLESQHNVFKLFWPKARADRFGAA